MISKAEIIGKMMLPLFGLCILCLLVIKSFSVITGSSNTPPDNYYVQLTLKITDLQNKLKHDPSNPVVMRKLALLLWQNNQLDLAIPYLEQLWKEHKVIPPGYDQAYVEDGLNLAGLYMDSSNTEPAEQVYTKLLEYEQSRLAPQDARIGRDLNNLGLCYIRRGLMSRNDKERNAFFDRAIGLCNQAAQIFRSSPKTESQLYGCLQNEVIAYSELGQDEKALSLSKEVNRQLDKWNERASETRK